MPASEEISESPQPSAGSRRLVLVAGAGRSGTSTVAGVLQRLGLIVPSPELGTDETNPKGFSEPQWVIDFHDDLLFHAVVQVSDARPDAWARTGVFADRPGAPGLLTRWLEHQFSLNEHLVVKDPRLAWFLPLWINVAHAVGAEPAFVTMLRPPAEIVGSKRTYYNDLLQDASGVAAWLNMLLGTEQATRGSARVFVRYHDLLADWEPVIGRMGSALDLRALGTLTDDQRASVNAFIDPNLHRVGLTWSDLALPARLEEMARAAWEALDALAGPGREDPACIARLDTIRTAYDAYYRESELVSRSSVIAVQQQFLRAAAKAEQDQVPRGAAGLLRRIPPSVRRAVPRPVRARARAAIDRRRQGH